jgi:choline dehydrogenase
MLASNVAEAFAFAASRGGGPIDIELLFGPVLYENEGLVPPADHGCGPGAILLKPRSRGHVALGANGAALIDPAYLSDPEGEDLARLIAGVRLGHKIMRQAPMLQECVDLPPIPTDDEIGATIRAVSHTVYHPVGTCRMGADDDAVVDHNLRVRGVDHLWVADASIMPEIPSGHPNAVVAAVADRAAQLIA